MDIRIFEILNFLNQFGVGKKQNIAPIMNKHFPVEENIQMHIYNNEVGNILRFIEELKPFVKLNSDVSINQHNNYPKEFINSLLASINNVGIKEIEIENKIIEEKVLNRSAIETNRSIIDTNKSVQKTNEALIEISKEQGVINSGIIENSTKQTKILRRQTLIFLFTAIFGLGSVATSVITLYRDTSKNTLQIQLQQQSKELQLLRTKLQQPYNKNHDTLSQNKNDTLKY